jgi:hypothetical protein
MKPCPLLTLLTACATVTGSLAQAPDQAPPARTRFAVMHGHGAPPGLAAPIAMSADPVGEALFPPDLIFSNQQALGITEAQLAAFKKLIQETHSAYVDVQLDMQRTAETLRTTLEADRIDEAAALAAAEEFMKRELVVKRLHLQAMIRGRNLLTAEQIKKLRELRDQRTRVITR